MKTFPPSELIINADGSAFHLHLRPEQLADRVILVGDPGRVSTVAAHFSEKECEVSSREFHSITGTYQGKRITVLSTGIGCDNIDIVMTELDAALHISGNGKWNETTDRQLKIVRIGTSGSLQADIDCGSHVASAYAIGLDGLMNYYREWDTPLPDMDKLLKQHLTLDGRLATPYCVAGSATLLDKVAIGMHHGITATAPGFYGPQGRTIHLHPSIDGLNEKLASFSYNGLKVTNLEMETSAIFGFSHLLGHEALTVCLIIANRPQGTFLNDYHDPMRQLVGTIVERLAE